MFLIERKCAFHDKKRYINEIIDKTEFLHNFFFLWMFKKVLVAGLIIFAKFFEGSDKLNAMLHHSVVNNFN